MTTAQFDISSIGRVAAELQHPTAKIAAIAKQLGIEPAGRINGIPHFENSDVERIAAQIRASDLPITKGQ